MVFARFLHCTQRQQNHGKTVLVSFADVYNHNMNVLTDSSNLSKGGI